MWELEITNFEVLWCSMVELKKYHSWKAKTKMCWKHGHFQNQSPISEMLNWFFMIYLTSLQETPSRPPFKPTKIAILKDHFICRLLGRQVFFLPLKTVPNEPFKPETTTMPRHRSCMMHLQRLCGAALINAVFSSKQLLYKWYGCFRK